MTFLLPLFFLPSEPGMGWGRVFAFSWVSGRRYHYNAYWGAGIGKERENHGRGFWGMVWDWTKLVNQIWPSSQAGFGGLPKS